MTNNRCVQMAKEKQVFANVGLKFTSADGVEHTLHRKLQCVLQKSGQRTMKTLGASWKENSDEINTSMQRSKPVDDRMSDLLGVTPAILDSVIFCHQEESLWPMSEPSALKKRFDEIFDASKYSKGVELLKVTRKRRGDEWRLLQQELGALENDKKKAIENSKVIAALNQEIEDLAAEAKKLQEKADAKQQSAKEKREEANQYLSIVQDLRNLQQQFDMKEQFVKDLLDSIDILPDTVSDIELQRTLDQYEAQNDRLRALIEQDAVQYKNLEDEVQLTRDKLNSKLADKGKLESDKEKYERQLQTRVEMIRNAASQHGIRGFANDVDNDQIQLFSDKIQSLLNSKNKDYEKLQNDMARTSDEASAKISELEGEKSTLAWERTSAKKTRADNERRIKRLQTDADSVDCDEGRISILEKTMATLDARFQTAQADFSSGDWETRIQGAKSQLNSLEKTGEELTAELVSCTRLSSERAQLDLRKKELRERESNLSSLVGTYSTRISRVLDGDFDIDSLATDYKSVITKNNAIVAKTKAKCDALQKELDQCDFEQIEARKRHITTLEAVYKYEESIVKVLKEVAFDPDNVTIDHFDAELESLESNSLEAEKELNLFDEMKSYYEGAQTTLETKNKCQLCQRAFADDQSKSKILQKIRKHLDDREKKELQKECRETGAKLAKLTGRRSDYIAFSRLKDDVPKFKKEVDAAQQKRDDKLHQLETAEAEHNKVADALNEVESLSKSISEITQLHTAIQEANAQIGRLESQSQMSGTGRSADEIQDAQSVNSERLKEAKKQVENLTRERQRSLDLMSNLELERSENRNRLAQAQQQMEKKLALGRDVKALRGDNESLDVKVATIDQDLRALIPRIDAARGQRDAELERSREKARLVGQERDAVAQSLSTLKMIEDDIQDYETQGKASSLASVERAIQSLQQQNERLKDEMNELMTRINTQKHELAQGDHRKKNISDNLRYREGCRTLDSLTTKIDRLQAHNAEDDYNNLVGEAKGLEGDVAVLNNKISGIQGSIGAKDQALEQNMQHHETFYKGIEEKYKRAKIEVETQKLAIEDLGTFNAALDKAVMEYHSLKMQEVNRIIGELWRATYQGTDIDSVAIRSEAEDAKANAKKKNYNYRVTMIKDSTEMDMRGRCSAGQKVLASIIIRLALAESFGINCGIIALDEPTTNLDSDNIESLAKSLEGIVRARQSQVNFQLIIITHDEHFLRHMRCSDFTDFFYRVKRDEYQHSKIIKQHVSKLYD